eukprot:symbB.v1.2.001036.t1/scaffold56.1/size371842/7
MLEVLSAGTGESVAVFEHAELADASVKALRQRLTQELGIPRFRLRLLQDNCLLDDNQTLIDDETLTHQVVQLVKLEFLPPDMEQDKGIMVACEGNDEKLLERHLNQPRSPNFEDAHAKTPLFVAASNGSLKCILLLLEAGAEKDKGRVDTGATPLFIAADQGHLEVVRFLVESGANKDQGTTDNGLTPLLVAAGKGHLEVVRFLVESGANKDQASTDNEATPLLIAAANGHLEVVRFLVESGWLDCNFQLTLNDYEACDFWMTPERYDAYGAREDQHPTFILRHAGRPDGNNSVMQNETHLMWGTDPIPFHVSEWVPEGCGFRPQPPPVQYETAANQITVTMSTHLEKYADSIKFRQVLTSIFTHLKETEFYIKEFLIIDDWFDGRSVALNGTQLGPTVEESRRENLAFFPGCVGVNASLAEERMPQHRCTFVYQSKEQQGQARATNILLDLMKTEFWLHIDMDSVLQQVIIQVPKSSRLPAWRWPVYFEEDIIEEEKERKIKEEKEAKKRALEEEKRRLSNPDCQVVAGVRLRRPEHAPSWGRDHCDCVRWELLTCWVSGSDEGLHYGAQLAVCYAGQMVDLCVGEAEFALSLNLRQDADPEQ